MSRKRQASENRAYSCKVNTVYTIFYAFLLSIMEGNHTDDFRHNNCRADNISHNTQRQ